MYHRAPARFIKFPILTDREVGVTKTQIPRAVQKEEILDLLRTCYDPPLRE